MGRPATDKRERLVAAAAQRFHQSGAARTSLAEVAGQAGVPPGNVFYYFKTKDDLAKAVVDDWCVRLAGHLAALETDANPWGRLRAFIVQTSSMVDMYVQWGCPFAGFARDLRHTGGTMAHEAPRAYAVQLKWMVSQFELAGVEERDADAYARFALSAIHGSILLAHAAADPVFIETGLAELTTWLDGVRQAFPQSHHAGSAKP